MALELPHLIGKFQKSREYLGSSIGVQSRRAGAIPFENGHFTDVKLWTALWSLHLTRIFWKPHGLMWDLPKNPNVWLNPQNSNVSENAQKDGNPWMAQFV